MKIEIEKPNMLAGELFALLAINQEKRLVDPTLTQKLVKQLFGDEYDM